MGRLAPGLAVFAIVLGVAVAAAWFASPWPRVALIRFFFDRGGAATARALAAHVPPGVAGVTGLAYLPGDTGVRMDVFFPAAVQDGDRRLPTVVWVHGGGWVAGSRGDVANYARILAAAGFTTVVPDYTLPPRARYPVPVEQVNAALGYLAANAGRLHVDPDRFVMAGDSAGAQIAAQVANLVTSPDYARAMGIVPAIRPGQLRATLLACGAYDLERAGGEGGLYAKFFAAAFWAYAGSRDFKHAPRFQLMSVARYLTPRFPPTFLTAGNGDPLAGQSRALAQRLEALGVPVDALLYAPDHRPVLPHEYQFDLDSADGREALRRSVAFLRARTSPR